MASKVIYSAVCDIICSVVPIASITLLNFHGLLLQKNFASTSYFEKKVAKNFLK